ncbi:membrane-bound metal-dependent hydrolase [Methanocaldococcus infernus ME]|uniref:Membrane-bound metal-dependent hydrolase n=1 Tax=Methanocaldococcus infernus (strain DSM 11812 / JCM 15783 / ME) TaxID=573063 RepID=D5VRG2_METIM|nr:metal-dependent hydrolase [Methanocaldococcus infernus]ADG13165.1 membrane-bound metal-dependent hydrolase [Methanocaldococcus infernus ME]
MNWKEHCIFGFLLYLPFFSSPEDIFLLLSGILFPDLDHEVKEEITRRGIYISLGILILALILYFSKSPLFNLDLLVIGVLSLLIYIVPYFSEHRGLTHTVWSLIIISLIFSYIIFRISSISPLAPILGLAMVSSEKIFSKLIIPSIFLSIILSLFLPHKANFISYVIPFFFGYLSHLIGDSLTPAGVKAFYPLRYKLKKTEGYILIVVIIILAVIKWMRMI